MELHLPDAAATEAAGRRLAPLLDPGDLVVLDGALGAGKTTLVRGLARGLGWPEQEPVPSPTFTLIQELQTPRVLLVHADLYRIGEAAEIAGTGLLEHLAEGEAVVAVEWGGRFAEALGPADWHLLLEERDGGRLLRVRARRPDRLAALAAGQGDC